MSNRLQVKSNKLIRLAVTGGIACGKSLCGEYLQKLGCHVCDTDVIARNLLARGQRQYDEVVAWLGNGILDCNADIDRRRLGQLVFADPESLEKLNCILHAEIRRHWQSWLTIQEQAGAIAAAVLIPLFYETGEHMKNWDAVICVAASAKVCGKRLRGRGWSAREISERNRAQWPLKEKILRADVVLYNNGRPDWLGRQVELVFRRLLDKKACDCRRHVGAGPSTRVRACAQKR